MSEIVSAYRCLSCEELFLEPGGPLYECSSCGGTQVDERRCESCNRFMSKLGDESCPECETEEIEPCEAWQGADSNLYESEQAELEYIAEAPLREEQARKSKEWERQFHEEQDAKNRARNERLLPKLLRLRVLLKGRAPQLLRTIEYDLEDMRRDPARGGQTQANLYFPEMAELFAPNLVMQLAIASNWEADYDDRRAAEAEIRSEILKHIRRPSLVERMDDPWFTHGTGLGFDIEVAADGLIEALEGIETP